MTDNKQPYYGDGAVNDPGNDGYGYEEHESFVNIPRPVETTKEDDERVFGEGVINRGPIKLDRTEDTKQRVFGDKAVNNKGNNGYGFEEHEQYVESNDRNEDTSVENNPTPVTADNTSANIQVIAGDDINNVRAFAAEWRMVHLGDAMFDDGEAITDDRVNELTTMYFSNDIPNKTRAFMKSLVQEYPNVRVELTEYLGPDAGDDLSRFGLDFSGLDEDDLSQGV